MMYILLQFLTFLMLGVPWDAWICEFTVFTEFGKHSIIRSSNIFFFSLFLLLLSPLGF